MSKNLVILGSGESGVGAALLAQQQGYRVFVSEGGLLKDNYRFDLIQAGIDFEEGGHTLGKILAADEVVKSPGIPENNGVVMAVREHNIPVISEIELGYRYKGDSKIIAITGSNGKTTTTALTYHICNAAGLDCALVGNIGYAFARQVALAPKEWYIIEVSSFQLDDIYTFKPDVAILTNITEDHLDRYQYKFENYINSKFRIIENQAAEDVFIYNYDDEIIKEYLTRHTIKSKQLPISMSKEFQAGAFIKDGDMYVRTGENYMTMSVNDFVLKGKHNQYNTMAACVATASIRIRKEKIRESLQDFKGLEHRMEHVLTIKGVDFINDSKATNINSVWYALESMVNPVVLIMGGVDKGNDYALLAELVQEKVKAIVCLGMDNHKIHEAFKDMVSVVIDTVSAQDAVTAAYQLAQKGDTVLLSPGCASFDLFKNYEDRGIQFKEAVRNL